MSECLCQPFLKVKNSTGAYDVYYSVVYESLPPEFQAVAEKELNETPTARENGIRKLKEYMERKDMSMMEEHLLLAVLRNCKFDIKKSETKLRNFHRTKLELFKQLQALDMETIEKIIDDMMFGMLPYRDKQGKVIVFTRPYGDWETCRATNVFLLIMIAKLFILSFPLTSVTGTVYFGECKTETLSIFYPVFNAFRKYIPCLLSMPIRVSRAEILNENYLCRCFYRFMKTILSKKFMDRVSLHGSNFDKLFQMYSPAILPEEFEGKMGPLNNNMYREKLLNFINDIRNKQL